MEMGLEHAHGLFCVVIHSVTGLINGILNSILRPVPLESKLRNVMDHLAKWTGTRITTNVWIIFILLEPPCGFFYSEGFHIHCAVEGRLLGPWQRADNTGFVFLFQVPTLELSLSMDLFFANLFDGGFCFM